METNLTMRGALWAKAVELVDRSSPRDLGVFLLKCFLALLLSAVAMDGGRIVRLALAWKQGMLPTVFCTFLLVFGLPPLWRLLMTVLPEPEAPREDEGDTIEGIPVSEILHHLFTEKSWHREELRLKFRASRQIVSDLGKHLERVGVLVRLPENNKITLNPDFTRSDVASILTGAKYAKDLSPLFRRDERGLTSEPSGPLLRAATFSTREMANVAP